MKRSKSNNLQTPIKKWQQMSPMEDELAIVESDLSSAEQPQLFTSLVACSPFLESPSPSSQQIQEEYSESQSSPPLSSQNSFREELPFTVKEMKVEESFAEERLPLQPVDTNRKGCNCRHSKCEKGYCDCLRMGLTCDPSSCSCQGCQNLEQKEIHKKITKQLVKQSIIGKGCHCKKSKCLKKYCQCHNAGRKCTSLCECVECCNKDENSEPSDGGSMLQKLRGLGNRQLNIYSE